MIQCQAGNLPMQPQDLRYVQAHGEMVKSKLVKLGILFADEQQESSDAVLSTFLSRFTASKRGETERKLIDVARRMERFFGPAKDMREITKLDAVSFRNWLVESEGLAESSTARRAIGYASQIMAAAVEDELIPKNPFKGKEIPKTVRTNKDRHHYINEEDTQKLWDAIQTREDRIRFVLLRFLGLRAPSELDALTWRDVNWATGFVTIRASKTKHHKDQGVRRCPITHPTVSEVLREAYAQRSADDAPIVPAISAPALRRRVIRWVGRAGLELWPQLMVNFRRSAVTDAHDRLPPHVVSAYFGHSEAISEANYTMRTAEHAAAFRTPVVKLEKPQSQGKEVA
jgi:integrase